MQKQIKELSEKLIKNYKIISDIFGACDSIKLNKIALNFEKRNYQSYIVEINNLEYYLNENAFEQYLEYFKSIKIESLNNILYNYYDNALGSKIEKLESIKITIKNIISYSGDLSLLFKEPSNLKSNRTILEHANDIIYNRSEDKERQYGPMDENLDKCARIASEMCNKEITTEDFYKCMIALKVGRMAFNTKYDTLLDACGYIAGLHNFNEKQKCND